MYAPEQYVEAPPTVEALCFIVQQYLRMRGSSRPDNYQMAPPQQQQPPQPNQQPNLPAAIPPPQRNLPNHRRINNRHHTGSNPKERCFNCGGPLHFVIDCPLRDRARKPV